ncbi:MAG: hypothetical protein J6S67_03550 [Methanobrevibacter sp.]|nr:hypothetical protein [Methanobrevibacter sp.]
MGVYIKSIILKDEPINLIVYPNGKVIKSNSVYNSETYPFEEITFEEITFNDTEHIPEIYEGVNILSHGRLIDADKIGLTDIEIFMCSTMNGDKFKNALEMLLEKIENAPIIIPAEREG